jgi:hypothetical protein
VPCCSISIQEVSQQISEAFGEVDAFNTLTKTNVGQRSITFIGTVGTLVPEFYMKGILHNISMLENSSSSSQTIFESKYDLNMSMGAVGCHLNTYSLTIRKFSG